MSSKDLKKKKKDDLPKSETVIVSRSSINFNPRNVKKHEEKDVKEQLKNFKSVGFLGGIVWNEQTGNLVSGHKRLMALDLFYKNTAEAPVDYEVKVEKVNLPVKQELEQMIRMDSRATNTAQDYALIADILPEIDPKEAGLDEIEISLVMAEMPHADFGATPKVQQDFKKIEKTAEEKKQAIKEMKKQIIDNIEKSQGESYVTLSFDSYENKAQFMDAMGLDTELTILKGEEFFEKVRQ